MTFVDGLLALIQAHPGLTAAVVAVVLYLVLGGAAARARAREALLGLMLRAEKAARKGEFGLVTGEELREIVIQQFLQRVRPVLLRRFPFLAPFVTEAWVRTTFDWLYAKAMDWLDDGKFNGSVVAAARGKVGHHVS